MRHSIDEHKHARRRNAVSEIYCNLFAYTYIYFSFIFSTYEFSCYLWEATFFLLSPSSNAACCFSCYWLVMSHDRSMVLHCSLSTSTTTTPSIQQCFSQEIHSIIFNFLFLHPPFLLYVLQFCNHDSWMLATLYAESSPKFFFSSCAPNLLKSDLIFSFSFVVFILYTFPAEFSFLPNTWSEQIESKQKIRRTCKSDDFWGIAFLKTEVIENVEKRVHCTNERWKFVHITSKILATANE